MQTEFVIWGVFEIIAPDIVAKILAICINLRNKNEK